MIGAFFLGQQSAAVRWSVLLILSAGLAGLLTLLRFPAALLLGPMLAGVALSAVGGSVNLSERAFGLAQGLIGCMIASMLTRAFSGEAGGDWFVLAFGAFSVILISSALGWGLSRSGLLPGTTAVWGLSPGAAATMTILSEDYGANQQIVALMQYLRVVIVALSASAGARVLGGTVQDTAAAGPAWFAPIHWAAFLPTLALAIAGPVISKRLGLRAGALLIPMFAGAILGRLGVMTIELPRWLLVMAYAVLGWRIGLRFTPSLLALAAKALPRILACTLALIALCIGLSRLLVMFDGIDPLTAYLATSPGGADTAAIIAAASHNVDAGFIMTMQTLRFVMVLILGPALAKMLSRKRKAG